MQGRLRLHETGLAWTSTAVQGEGMASGVTRLLATLLTGNTAWDTASGNAWASEYECPHCGGRQLLRVAAVLDGNLSVQPELTQWFRCPGCNRGSVLQDEVVFPNARPLREPRGLPADVAAIWDEARTCLGAGAYAAAVLMCRKILLHVAVEHGLPAKNARDRAPSFVECVEQLEVEGVVTSRMRPWVDAIKDIGNDATHELTPVAAGDAERVATFTLQLLVLAYEHDVLMGGDGAGGGAS